MKDTVPKQPVKFVINNIRITRGFVKYIDLALNHTIELDSLDLLIPGFTWNSDSTNLDVDFKFVDGGGLYSSLAVNQADSTYSINLKLDSLNLGIIEPYIKNSLNISSFNGYLSNDLLIKGSITSVLKLFIHGINHIYGFQLMDTLNRTIFSFNDLTINIDTLQLDKNRIRINNIGLTDPFILMELIDTTNNWFALMKPVAGEQADSTNQISDTTETTTDFSYNFPHLTISGGKVLFTDKTLRYPFEYNIDNLRIESEEIAGIPVKLSIHISAGLNGTGTFVADGILNPDDFNDMDLAAEIGQFRMKDIDAYFKHYFGFPVTGGIMNFKTDNKILPGSLVSNNSLYFRKFTLAEKMQTETEFKISLRLALGVLSDKDGIIDLKAPVKMEGDEVKILNLGRIIFRIIGNLFVKAAVSPFNNLLSGLYEVDPATLQEIHLGLNEPSPDAKNMKSVDIIADILSKKPGLNVDFIYCINSEKATDSIAYMMVVEDFRKSMRSTGINQSGLPDSTLVRYLLEKPSSGSFRENPELNVLCRNYIGMEKLNSRLDSLTTLQTGFMVNYLSRDKEIPSGRIH